MSVQERMSQAAYLPHSHTIHTNTHAACKHVPTHTHTETHMCIHTQRHKRAHTHTHADTCDEGVTDLDDPQLRSSAHASAQLVLAPTAAGSGRKAHTEAADSKKAATGWEGGPLADRGSEVAGLLPMQLQQQQQQQMQTRPKNHTAPDMELPQCE
jgi:hypothetical protein